MLHCSTLYYSISHYIALNLAILIKKVITWWCGGVVVWFVLLIIEQPQSRLFNSGLNWVVAISLLMQMAHIYKAITTIVLLLIFLEFWAIILIACTFESMEIYNFGLNTSIRLKTCLVALINSLGWKMFMFDNCLEFCEAIWKICIHLGKLNNWPPCIYSYLGQFDLWIQLFKSKLMHIALGI